MKTKQLIGFCFFPALVIGVLLLSAQAAVATPYRFTITLENHSNNVLTPAPFITHNSGFDLFSSGMMASSQVEMLAEDGITSGVESLALAGQSAGSVYDFTIASNGGPIGPGGSVTFDLLADPSHGLLSFMSMLAFSNDAFIGGATDDGAISLFSGGMPVLNTYFISPNHVWDAGTEVNDELEANVPALGGSGGVDENGYIFLSHLGLTGSGNIPLDRNWLGDTPVAQIHISAANPVPVPGSLLLLSTGVLCMVGLSRNRNQK